MDALLAHLTCLIRLSRYNSKFEFGKLNRFSWVKEQKIKCIFLLFKYNKEWEN